ncbi:MAG: helix-turn-helix transcriptional regulator [Chloroflexi bacterium]|nr:helix-turn-helix transcriptional regulator [Chloroflexota bacterium]
MPGWRFRHREGFERGRPRRIRRFIEPALLLLLHHGPAHGYGLLEGLRALGLEDYPADISAVYRILYALEAQGMVISHMEAERSGGPPRRVYQLTEAGDAYLRAWVEDLRATDRILHQFLDAYEDHEKSHREPASGSPSEPVEGRGP